MVVGIAQKQFWLELKHTRKGGGGPPLFFNALIISPFICLTSDLQWGHFFKICKKLKLYIALTSCRIFSAASKVLYIRTTDLAVPDKIYIAFFTKSHRDERTQWINQLYIQVSNTYLWHFSLAWFGCLYWWPSSSQGAGRRGRGRACLPIWNDYDFSRE